MLTPRLLEQTFAEVVDKLLAAERRLLLFGAPGTGKSTLAAQLAAQLARAGSTGYCIGADPGSPAFGAPGAVCLGRWNNGDWELLAMEALCSLDAARFRLPLLDAVRRLAAAASGATLFIDSPGVVRGVAAAELLTGLAAAANVDAILCVTRGAAPLPLRDELAALAGELWRIDAAEQARQPAGKARARQRSRLWDAWLQGADETTVDLDRVAVLGTAPPLEADASWIGRQAGLLEGARTLALGEITGKHGKLVQVRCPAFEGELNAVVIRDARMSAKGLLQTAAPEAGRTAWYTPPPDMLASRTPDAGGGPRPVQQAGSATAILVNGVFGDPLLHLRLRHRRRSLLFDLGEAGRLPARVAHQVTDVFISHAHFDHIAGFLWLLRSRLGVPEVCRVYGPPGLARHIQHFIDAVHWDRIGENGPRFAVSELHGDRLVRTGLQVGAGPRCLAEVSADDGLLLDDPDVRVRATTLDHGIPVLAFAVDSPRTFKVRKDRLLATGLPTGPWLGKLKAACARNDSDAVIELPGGRRAAAGALAGQFLLARPGEKLVYATDLADTADNRARLTDLARGAHAFFCEAVFAREHAARARRSGHLTAQACGEIAAAAGVERLIPFHFSRRYEEDACRIYGEVAEAFPRSALPKQATSCHRS